MAATRATPLAVATASSEARDGRPTIPETVCDDFSLIVKYAG